MGGRSSSLPEPIKIERAEKVMEHNRVDRSVMLLLLLQVPTMRWSGRMASYGLWALWQGMDVICKASYFPSTQTHLFPLWLRWMVLLHGCTKYSLDSGPWPRSKIIARIASFVHWYAPIWYGCQPRINNLRQRPDLGGGLVTHVACMIGKCGNEGSRSEVPALLPWFFPERNNLAQ